MTDDAINIAFGEQLKKLIGEKSVNSFAQKCGLGESLIRRYINGAMPRIDKLMQIAKANNVSPEWLITGEESGKGEQQAAVEVPGNDLGQIDVMSSGDTIRISEKLQKTAVILESETIYRTALAANIDAFHHAVKQEDKVKKNEETLRQQQQTISGLEARMASLEKLLSSVSATPGDYEKNAKNNAA